jgi:hypothetical protein
VVAKCLPISYMGDHARIGQYCGPGKHSKSEHSSSL